MSRLAPVDDWATQQVTTCRSACSGTSRFGPLAPLGSMPAARERLGRVSKVVVVVRGASGGLARPAGPRLARWTARTGAFLPVGTRLFASPTTTAPRGAGVSGGGAGAAGADRATEGLGALAVGCRPDDVPAEGAPRRVLGSHLVVTTSGPAPAVAQVSSSRPLGAGCRSVPRRSPG